ncbi:hypothetical protein LTS18_009842 [Coniosporium uncinatum]|uniref:Uncharacterized protein n=1 Tax=Coniosporium uncinatum TaxID=93489 RepID=A0ACC3DWV1_9PEZI|nr:hypothetical protein LTS18_009842 [Coniosporium uncinatum]
MCRNLHEQLEKIKEEQSLLSEKQRAKIKKFKDAIQPHTDEGGASAIICRLQRDQADNLNEGDAYYIDDAYREINPVFAKEWRVQQYDSQIFLRKDLLLLTNH